MGPGRLLLRSALFLLLHSCIAVPTIEQLQKRMAPAEAGLDALWADYTAQLEAVQIASQPLQTSLGPLAKYPFSLSPTQLQRSFISSGNNPRLRRIVQRLLTGRKHVKVGVIGTSVSWGTGGCNAGV